MWLEERLKEKGISQLELARRSGLSAGAINHVLSGRRNPGEDFCTKIARGLGLPPETVFRAAGLLPPLPDVELDLIEARELRQRLGERRFKRLMAFGWLEVEDAETRDELNKEGKGKNK